MRTDSLQREARIARLFRALEEKGAKVDVFGVVKSIDGFSYLHREHVCRADRIRLKLLKVPLKLLEIQFTAIKAFRAHYRSSDLLIIANHEFLLFGLLIRLFTRTPVVVDLHEHYFTWLFGIRRFSQLFFLRVFSGVIFANRIRALDFLSDRADSENVVIARNFPNIPAGSMLVPQYCRNEIYRVGIVGGDVPGRYIRESVQALDILEFKGQLELVTFGKPLDVQPANVAIHEHGAYQHWEIFDLLGNIDCSLVFYDPKKSANYLLCEPNRFFEAYNSGKTIFCFDHPSLSEFYDEQCFIIDESRFETDLIQLMNKAIDEKIVALRNHESANGVNRHLLVFDEGIENLDFLLQI